MSPARFNVGKWLVEPDLCRIVCASDVVQLEPKTMDVLLFLAQNQNRVVSAEEIIAQVWDGRPMSDNPVYKCIAKLRKAFMEEQDNAQYIVTIPKKGYQLVSPVLKPKKANRINRIRHPLSLIAIGLILGIMLAYVVFSPPTEQQIELQLVSSFPGSHSQASFSPDGSHIAFVNKVDGKSNIFMLNLNSSVLTQLTFDEETVRRPKWSVNNDQILYQKNNSLWQVSVSSATSKQLIRNGLNASWSRNGDKIVFERRFQIWTANADGGDQQRVEGVPESDNLLTPRYPAFSPDGRFIAFFQSHDTPLGDLWLIPTAGGKARQITHSPALGGGPVWTSDGQSLIYSSLRGGSRTLWQVSTSDGTGKPLLNSSGDDVSPAISFDGKRLIYTNSRNRFVLTATDIQSGQEHELFETRHTLLAPEVSPDQQSIVFFTHADIGGMQIFKMDVNGGRPELITHEPDSINAIPQWSGDGQSIYYYQTNPGTTFRKIQPGASHSAMVADNWQWSVQNGARVNPQQTHIAYSRMDNGAPVSTIIRDIESNEENPFYATLEWPHWSKDGESLIGGLFDQQRTFGDIAECRLLADRCRVLAKDAHIPTWSHDQKRIFYVREDSNFQQLWSIDRYGENDEEMHLRLGPLFHPGPFYNVTKEGQVIWVKFEKARDELWLVKLTGD